MYQKLTRTDSAAKLPIDQDAWLLHSFDKLEVEAGKECCWSNKVNQILELLVIKTRE